MALPLASNIAGYNFLKVKIGITYVAVPVSVLHLVSQLLDLLSYLLCLLVTYPLFWRFASIVFAWCCGLLLCVIWFHRLSGLLHDNNWPLWSPSIGHCQSCHQLCKGLILQHNHQLSSSEWVHSGAGLVWILGAVWQMAFSAISGPVNLEKTLWEDLHLLAKWPICYIVTWFVFCWALFYFVTFTTVSAWFDEFIIIVLCDFAIVVTHCVNFLCSYSLISYAPLVAFYCPKAYLLLHT